MLLQFVAVNLSGNLSILRKDTLHDELAFGNEQSFP